MVVRVAIVAGGPEASLVARALSGVNGVDLVDDPGRADLVVAGARRLESLDDLSLREREVLALLARGHTNREVASRLFISIRTAELHRANIIHKLGLRTRAELADRARRAGLLD